MSRDTTFRSIVRQAIGPSPLLRRLAWLALVSLLALLFLTLRRAVHPKVAALLFGLDVLVWYFAYASRRTAEGLARAGSSMARIGDLVEKLSLVSILTSQTLLVLILAILLHRHLS